MSRNRLVAFVGAAGAVLLLATVAAAQEGRRQLTLQGAGVVTEDSEGPGVSREATRSGGLLIGYSYRLTPWADLEANYGYTRNTQRYLAGLDVAGRDAVSSDRVGPDPVGIESNIHELFGTFVPRIPTGGSPFEPYLLAGGGMLIFDPTSDVTLDAVGGQTKVAFAYGAGVDVELARGVGVRVEYRGLLYEAPDFGVNALRLERTAHVVQPSLGVFVRF